MVTMVKAQWIAMIRDTILKELRSKTLLFIFISTTAMIILANALLKMYVSSDLNNAVLINASSTLSFMFSLINMWSLIIATIFGISSIRSDFKDHVIYQYLTFPISRTQYMFSRIFGTWILVFGYYLYSYILSSLLVSFATHTLALHWTHLVSMLLMSVYIYLVIFISFLYSMFAGKIAAFLLVISTFIVVGASTHSLRDLVYADYFKDLSFFKLTGLIVYFIFPRINYITEVASNVLLKEEIKLNIGLESLHLLVTSAVFIFIADRIMKKKNF